MRHLKWIKALQLNRWAAEAEAKGMLPEVVRRLVHATLPAHALQHIDFPGGEETQRPGYDGVTRVKAGAGNAKIPDGAAVWEMSTEGSVKKKLDKDFAKRTEKRGEGDFSGTTYIAVTARDFQNKTTWAAERSAEGKWSEVRVYDSSDLEQWLEMAPGVALWLSRFVNGQKPEGMLDVATYWDNVRHRLKRSVSAAVLFAGRESIRDTFSAWQSGAASILSIHGHTAQEVLDVFAAWVEMLSPEEQAKVASRVVMVETKDSWRQLVDSPFPLLLVVSDHLSLEPESIAEAMRKGHHVLRTVSAVRARGGEVVRLARMSRDAFARALMADGFAEAEARMLAAQAAGSFTVFKRRFSSVPLDDAPRWANPPDAEELAPLLFAGAWQDEKAGDRDVLVRLAARGYDGVRATVTRIHAQSDSPLRLAEGAWEFVALGDAWTFLHPYLRPEVLNVFEAVCGDALGVDDPRLDLPREERWLANIQHKEFAHSRELRNGLARMLALLATREQGEQISERISPQARVDRVVRAVLPVESTWRRWASLGDVLPLLAEAAPDVFLAAAEAGVRGDAPELAKLFAEEGSGFTGQAEHTGLLWALERLAWSPMYLPRTALVLAKLAAHDPGGQLANRPQASLREILCSWMPHTTATRAERLDVVEMLLQKQGPVGWRLLLELLPAHHDAMMEKSPPEWRFWAEDWKRTISDQALADTVRHLVEKAVEHANLLPEQWSELLDCVSTLRGESLEALLGALEALPRSALEAASADKLWDKLRDFVAQHEYFHEADNWRLPPGVLKRLGGLRDKWTPASVVTRAVPLFSHGFTAHGEASLPWEEQARLKRERQRDALAAIIAENGFAALTELVDTCDDVWGLGRLVAEERPHVFDHHMIPAWLVGGSKARTIFCHSYVGMRAGVDRAWAENYPRREWTVEQQAAFLGHLPFGRETWDFIASLGEAVESAYWKHTPRNSVELSRDDLLHAASRLLRAERVSAALDLVSMNERKGEALEGDELLGFLAQVVEAPVGDERSQLDGHHVMRLLKKAQQGGAVDQVRLSTLEWRLLPALKHQAEPSALYARLAEQPEFFLEVLKIRYKPRNAPRVEESVNEPVDEAKKQRFKRAWQLLRDWSRVPGTKEDGTVDAARLDSWVDATRAMAAEADRLSACDYVIGSVFARAPKDADGSWPCRAVREVIERLESDDLSRGFRIAVANGRGARFRAVKGAGADEREAAQRHEGLAAMVRARWPRTGALLDAVARQFEEEARLWDKETEVSDI